MVKQKPLPVFSLQVFAQNSMVRRASWCKAEQVSRWVYVVTAIRGRPYDCKGMKGVYLEESTLRLGIRFDLVLCLFRLDWVPLAACRLHPLGLCLGNVRLQQRAHCAGLVAHGHSQRSVASHYICIKAGAQQQGTQDCAHVKAVAALQQSS